MTAAPSVGSLVTALERLIPLAEARLECREAHERVNWTDGQRAYARQVIARARRLVTVARAVGVAED